MTSPAESRALETPFTHDTVAAKVRVAEDAWNGRHPERVALAYTEDRVWRNRAEFLRGRPAIVDLRAAINRSLAAVKCGRQTLDSIY